MTDKKECLKNLKEIHIYSQQVKYQIDTILENPLSINEMIRMLKEIRNWGEECYQISYKIKQELLKDD